MRAPPRRRPPPRSELTPPPTRQRARPSRRRQVGAATASSPCWCSCWPSPLRIEGLDDARWVLMDYGDFVVHVFLDDVRHFYELERLWRDAPVIDWRDARTSQAAAGE